MSLLKTFFGILDAVEPVLVDVSDRVAAPSKVEKNVARFRRAISQCTNPAKLDELRANLAYWEAVAAAQALIQPE